jgi:hypothetical protein
MLRALQTPGQHLIVGDFNLHHPLWGGPSITHIHAAAETLIDGIIENQLHMLLAPGTITREKNNEKSTLDLTLATEMLASRVVACRIIDTISGSDHLPIETTIQLKENIQTDRQTKRCFKRTNLGRVQTATELLQYPSSNLGPQGIDDYTDYLVQFIQDLIADTVPTIRPSDQARPWWDREVADAVHKERQAKRYWNRNRTEQKWNEFQAAKTGKRRAIAKAKQAYWRTIVHEAAVSPEGIWKLAKWARKRSYLPKEPAKMPDLKWNGTVRETVAEKADALAERFYPIVEADLTDITDREFYNTDLIADYQTAEDWEIQAALKRTKPDKCPGSDEITNRFLQAMGNPLIQALTALLNQCWKAGYYPKRFRTARTIVLRKPDRDYSDPGAWRPIALLSTLGKVLESVMACRLSELAEQHQLLPSTQMGNRKNRSTETALELLIEQIHTIWSSKKHVASVLSLDISGAFDTVNHLRLLDNLRKKGVPLQLIRTIRSFLTDRTTTLIVDGKETTPQLLQAGVPQGSPLSPILFLFYNGPLLEALDIPDLRLSAIGFADDINLLTYGESTTGNCIALESAHERCLEWAKTHGMCFAPKKYHLIHFTRQKKFDLTAPVQIEDRTIAPSPIIRILGLQLDSRLYWGPQIKAIDQKMKTQMYALSRIATSTWGATMEAARHVYLAVIRPAIAYGAALWHSPKERPLQGAAGKLAKHQNSALRQVLGAFKATPIRQLETEAYIPPLDLWLNGRIACFQARLERTGMARQIQDACTTIRIHLRTRGQRQRRIPDTPALIRKRWTEKWIRQPIEQWDEREKPRVLADWTDRWKKDQRKKERIVRPGTDPGDNCMVPEDPIPGKQVLKLHTGLKKAESSMLVQARTGRVGLAKFLYGRKVPGIQTAQCRCEAGEETVRHMILYCTEEASRRQSLRVNGRLDYGRLIGTASGAKCLTEWMIRSGRLGQFSLAKNLLYG